MGGARAYCIHEHLFDGPSSVLPAGREQVVVDVCGAKGEGTLAFDETSL